MYMEDVGLDVLIQGEMRYYNGDWRLYDQFGAYNPRSTSGSGLGLALFKRDGGLLYTRGGDLLIKKTA